MKPQAAKTLAKQHDAELWYDPHTRCWVLQPDGGEHHTETSDYMSPGSLRSMTPEQFVSLYLTRSK